MKLDKNEIQEMLDAEIFVCCTPSVFIDGDVRDDLLHIGAFHDIIRQMSKNGEVAEGTLRELVYSYIDTAFEVRRQYPNECNGKWGTKDIAGTEMTKKYAEFGERIGRQLTGRKSDLSAE